MKDFASEYVNRIRARLQGLYPDDDVELHMERLSMVVGRYGVGLSSERVDRRWDETDAVLITYGDMVRRAGEPPLRTLKRFCDVHLRDAISTVHILPFFPWTSDDGFSVVDYRAVDPELGTWKDVTDLHEHFDLMFDLVLNHCSRSSEWFKQYVLDVAPFRDYFIEVDPSEDLSNVVRPRALPLLSPVNKQGGSAMVWTTFSRDQVDLDFSNADVLFDFLDILLFYLSKGMRIIRLDAIAYLWKMIGTSCIHLPQTHEVVKLLRDIAEMVAPETIVLTETNVPHDENISYFGDGDEAHMVYQFSLPPLVLHALTQGRADALTAWASSLNDPPPGCTFLNFTASHDGIGVRPLQGLVPEEELNLLADRVRALGGQVSMKTNADGSQSPYELNITYFDALRDPESDDVDMHGARFLCSQTILLGMRGIPALYFHSLTATPNDEAGVRATGRARSINRMKWNEVELERTLGDRETNTSKVFYALTALLKRRSACSAFHPDAPQVTQDLGPAVFAFTRTALDGGETLLAIHNVTESVQDVPLRGVGLGVDPCRVEDMISDTTMDLGKRRLTLGPYQCAWLLIRNEK